MATTLSRRRFLRVGIAGAVALAAAGGAYRLLHNAPKPAPYVPDNLARGAFAAIAVSLLKGAMADTPANRAAAVDRALAAIAGLPLAAQKEIADLMGLLTLPATRRFLAGVPDDWDKARPADVDAFLNGWRHHRIGMLQAGYFALHDLIIGPWYADPAQWEAIGYPGPMKGF